jgi:hypothetical protein
VQNNKSKKFVSIDEIRGLYLKNRDIDNLSDIDARVTSNNLLTASAKHVVKEAIILLFLFSDASN